MVPKRLVIANIRRLQNSKTNYEVEEHRAFNLLPFSINDSALALFYDSEVILPNQRIALDFLLSSRPTADAGQLQALRDALAAIPISKVTSTVSVSSDNPSKVSGGRAELVQRINSMLATLTILMASESYKQVEIERLVQAIDTAQKQLSAEP